MIDHLSFSQWKAWTACPAAAYAQYVRRCYRPGTTEAMALGSLTEAAMTAAGDAETIIAGREPNDRALLLTQKGAPTTDARRAVEWGRQAAAIDDVLAATAGATLQAELRADVGNVPWVCRLDVWDRANGLVWDVKTCASPLGEEYVPRIECRGNFIAANRYGYQLALYAEAVLQETGEMPGVGIIAIGKHKTRDGRALPDVWLFDWQDIGQLQAYRDQLAASCLYPWTCDLGTIVLPIPEMYKAAPCDALYAASAYSPEQLKKETPRTRCESCDWCVASRQNRVRAYADPRKTERY